jgi:hypothetical protein
MKNGVLANVPFLLHLPRRHPSSCARSVRKIILDISDAREFSVVKSENERRGMNEKRQTSVNSDCLQIYEETKKFYSENVQPVMDVGFQILYGPPHFQAPVLFLGYQPGRGKKSVLEERDHGSEDRWPPQSEYVTEEYALAKRLQMIFKNDPEFLEKCVGMNAIFVRSNSIKLYRKNFPDHLLRKRIKEFCLQRVKKIVEAIEPVLIIAIGLETLDLFDGGEKGKRGEKGRVLTKEGKICGCNALGVLHLCTRISTNDRITIADEIRAASGSKK